jgi:hypothetical protein
MALIGIDFDHTLVEGSKAIPGAREALNALREAGHKVLIHSCNGTDWIERVMANNDMRFDGVWEDKGKPICDLYVDDRGYHFKGDWTLALPEIIARVEGKDAQGV